MIISKTKLFLNPILIILYLAIGFMYHFQAIDKIAPQFFYLSILNGIAFIYLLKQEGLKDFFEKTFQSNIITWLLYLFWGWSLFSLFYAVNSSEVIIESSRIFIYIHSFTNLYLLLKGSKISNHNILLVLSTVLMIEVIWVFNSYLDLYYLVENSNRLTSRSVQLRGFTGNINITAFAMTLKIPFLISYLFEKKNIQWVFKILIISFVCFTIFLLGSRGANLTLGLLFLGICVLGLKNKLISRKYIFSIISAFLLSVIVNGFIFQNSESLNYIERTSNIIDSSSQKRFTYYQYAVKSIIKNPLLGVGLGNWKIHSIKSDNSEMENYSVPYHVHNDFLEVAAELGILGFILYYGIYVFLFFSFIKFFRDKNISESDKTFAITVILGLLVYLSDSFLNFPFTRPVMQIPNLFLMAVSLHLLTKNKIYLFNPINVSAKNFLTYVFPLFSSTIICASIYVSFKVFQSFKKQVFLIQTTSDKNATYSPDQIYKIDTQLPNISVHTMPLDALKATLMLRLEEYDSIMKYVDKALKANPYIGYPEIVKSIYYLNTQKIDSSFKYAKQAYEIFPYQLSHYEHYLNLIEFKKDSNSLNKIYDDLKDNFVEKKYQKYLQVSSRMKNNISLSDKDLIKRLSINNPTNIVNKAFGIMGEIGRENVAKGYSYERYAIAEFEKKEYEKAAKLFEKASEFNSLEISYFENAANSYMKIGENQKAITILEKMIIDLKPKTGKAEYLLGINYIQLEESNLGCNYLEESAKKGFNFPLSMLDQFCNEKKS